MAARDLESDGGGRVWGIDDGELRWSGARVALAHTFVRCEDDSAVVVIPSRNIRYRSGLRGDSRWMGEERCVVVYRLVADLSFGQIAFAIVFFRFRLPHQSYGRRELP
jgi:hypothetical protein